MYSKTILQAKKDLLQKKYSAVELTEAVYQRIENVEPKVQAYVHLTREIALNQAQEADQKLAAGKDAPLLGIPIALKDLICMQNTRTTCSSQILDQFIAPYDATVVNRLKKAGAVILGKTNMDEFAMGSSNETSYFGPVHNPWDLARSPGGSSGGSAVAVAAGLAPIALGTDTGGSIRQPAAFTGITGLKPSYGRCSRYGMVAFASSLDQAGILALTAEDTAILLESLAGFDPMDSTSVEADVPKYSGLLNVSIEGKTVGIPKEFFDEGLDAESEQVFLDAIKVYESLGVQFKDISLPHLGLSVPTYYVVAPAECSSNLARYDGIRFGYRHDEIDDLDDFYLTNRQIGFGAEVKRRIITGTYVLSAGYYDAYYLKAQKVRQLISQDFKKAFQDIDAVMGPTTQTPAFKIGEKIDDPVTMYMNDIYTISANLAGLPAISHPCGFVQSLPFGLQIIAPHFAETELLNLTHLFQQETDWHQKQPPDLNEA